MASPSQPLCGRCHRRPGTQTWTDGGVMDYVHGMVTQRCRICCLEVQLEHAQQMAALVHSLTVELAEAHAAEDVARG